jgi:hypothetical protein
VGNCAHLHLEVHSSSLTFAQTASDDINPEPWLQYQGPRAAAVSWATNRLDLFFRGTGDPNNPPAVYHKFTADDINWYPSGQGNYDPLGFAGGGFAGQVSAASWGPNRIDLFAVGYDGNLWHKWLVSPSWYGWENLSSAVPPGIPSLIGTPTAVSYSSNSLSVFVRASSGSLIHVYYANAPWAWESHQGILTTDPMAISPGPNRIDVVAFGRKGDSTVASGYSWHQTWTSSAGWLPSLTGFDDWGTSGSGFVGQPALTSASDTNTYALAVSAEGNLWGKHYDGISWSGWQQFTGSGGPTKVMGSPSADSVASGIYSLFVREMNGTLWDCLPYGITCLWTSHGGPITNDPLVITANPVAQLEDVFVRATSPFDIRHQVWDGTKWVGGGGYCTACYDIFGGAMA